MNRTFQKLSAWSGFVAMNVFFLGLIIMKFFPPIPPSLTPAEVAAIYQAHAFEIRLGALLIVSTVYMRYHYVVDVLAGIGIYLVTRVFLARLEIATAAPKA